MTAPSMAVQRCDIHGFEMHDCECRACHGEGWREECDELTGYQIADVPCWRCHGKGALPIKVCQFCEEEAEDQP
jgi:DnaJ-class molecular chaperone